MKILHINTESGWRGGENQILLLLQGLAKQPDVDNHAVLLKGREAARRLAPFAAIKTIKARSGLSPLAALDVASYCRANHIQIIDAHSSKAHTLALLVKLLVPSLKLIVHRRVDNLPGADPINRWKYRTPLVDRYVAISSAIKKILEQAGVAPARIALAPSAVPFKETTAEQRAESRATLRAAHNIPADYAVFGNASALSHQKSYPTLLKACARLRDHGVKFHCFIAGDGPQKSDLEALRDKLGLTAANSPTAQVSFLGFIKDVTAFLRGLDFFTIPSANEGLGTIIMDATYCGLPVIGSRVGGIPEMIEHQVTGLLIEPGDDATLAVHMETYMNAPETAAAYQRACKDRLLEKFSLDAMVSGNLKVYRSLCVFEDHRK